MAVDISQEHEVSAVSGRHTLVSVVIPCRNEERFIGNCLKSIVDNDYPKEYLEVIAVDGMSDDKTRNIIQDFAMRYGFIKLLDNPKKITSAALNIGVCAAKGELLMWMSAHNSYTTDYISRSVGYIEQYEADNLGGSIVVRPRQGTLVGLAIATALSHRFGVGNSYFRIGSARPRWVDTVFGGCYRREVFERIGLFNEHLIRTQDMEFNLRLKKAGGRTLLAPDIVSYYYARSDFKSYWRHNVNNGLWAVLPFRYSSIVPVSWRHLVPLGFVTSLLGSALLGLIMAPFRWLGLIIVAAYGSANLVMSFRIARRKRNPRYLVVMPIAFGLLHVGYGLGSLWGVFRLAGTPKCWTRLSLLPWFLIRSQRRAAK